MPGTQYILETKIGQLLSFYLTMILKHSQSFRQTDTCIHTTVRTGSLKMYRFTQVTVADFIIIQSTYHSPQGRIVHPTSLRSWDIKWCVSGRDEVFLPGF